MSSRSGARGGDGGRPGGHQGWGRGRQGWGRGRSFSGDSAPFTQSTYEAGSSSTHPVPVAQISSDVEELVTLQSHTEPTERHLTQPAPSPKAKFVPRPGYGSAGNRCVIHANHFVVELADRELYHYDVSIAPEVTSRGLNRAVIKELLREQGNALFGGRKPAFDGRKGFYTAGPLPFTSKDFVVRLINKDDTGSTRKEREFKVSLKFASKSELIHLQDFLRGRRLDCPHEIIQVLDVVLRESPSNKCTVVGRSFFSPLLGDKHEIGNGVESWKGFYQSLRPTQMGMSLNIDVSATCFYEPIPVIEFVKKFLNLGDLSRAASRPLSDRDRLKLKKVLRGVKVQVTHGELKRYKITGITVAPTSQLTFSGDNKRMQSVARYFHEKYNINLRYLSWPALQSGNESKPIFLPMECCVIVEGQRYNKKLNERQVTAMLREACKRPREREGSIRDILSFNDYRNDNLSQEFGVSVRNELASIDARVLPPPVLKYHESGRDKIIRPRVGQWNMINAKLYNGATLNCWMCVNFSSLHGQIAIDFCRNLVSMCRSKGMDVNPTPLFPGRSGHPNQIEKTLCEIERMCSNAGKQLQLLIIILPDVSGSYGRIKRICETELGIVSQCCQPKQARRGNPQYLENVALKINVKTGGKNTVLEDAFNKRIPFLTDTPTIIFGADVTHPQPGEDSSPSIAAVVASMDWPTATTYRGLVSAQQHREEIIQDLYKVDVHPESGQVRAAGMFRELLLAFKRSTNQKPQRIIFYRDGISEGQFRKVLLWELDAIRNACVSLEEGYLPHVTFIVVQKRHHTRFLPTNPNQTDRSGNVLPGTVVDTKICHPLEFDFYLCSHAGIQGTSRPVHYHVLYDENRFSADALQTLTNSLCYTYARCTRSVSVVPPAYYAHLAAFRARYYVEGEGASESESGTGRGGTGTGTRREAGAVRPLPEIKPNVKEVMFYC
ncbi:hypothetical protein L6164_033771 [Bauhinia variegata]|uniref:Uncharacterized protein n=1 Tax=Bauhinia variegata TaxID=167791 RepID=A0ACB9KSV0_BAUVA|nr:hypothetical protein L6164_033771 [Bauhinia variegata]